MRARSKWRAAAEALAQGRNGQPVRSAARSLPDASQVRYAAQLVPVALALTSGILLDRYLAVPPLFSFGTTLACLFAWIVNRGSSPQGLALLYLWAACAGFGALYHHSADRKSVV